ncbi:MAG: hypothetical protein BWY70_00144 [Bacteroidetes bacterium ADurb.Bin408]|nr:MAG: hypothetical protein BWY70_00144 [Bacteroidetes bacterium ADurb.Bin408]
MKRTTFLILVILASCNLYAQESIEKAASEMANKIALGLKKCKDIPRDSKIAVLYFESSERMKTSLGMKLSQKTAIKLMTLLNKKDFTIMAPENVEQKKLNKISASFFSLPSKEESEIFYKNFNNSQRPDYFLTGKYYIDEAFTKLTLTEFSVQKNTYELGDAKKTACGFENVSVDILPADKNDIIKYHTVSLDEVGTLISEGISQKVVVFPELKSALVRVDNITLGNTSSMSEFSQRFTATIEQKLARQGLNVSTRQNIPGDTASIPYKFFLTGRYWEEGNDFKVAVLLKELPSERIVASEETKLSKLWLTANNISFKPENFERAKANEAIFNKDELKSTGDLKVEIVTNKGNSNLIFTEGDELKLWVKANKECYVRLVYYLADGQTVLMLDNFHVTPEYINKYYEIPKTFECSEPFGTETLQLFAQNEKFKPLLTEMKSGYVFVLDDTKAIVEEGRRGFKEKKEAAECRLSFTTLKGTK